MTNEVLAYRIDHQEEVLQQHAANIMALTENLRVIHQTLEYMLAVNKTVKDRLSELETDLKERQVKHYIFRLFIYVYPIMIAAMLAFANLDHAKLLEVADGIEGMIGFSKGL